MPISRLAVFAGTVTACVAFTLSVYFASSRTSRGGATLTWSQKMHKSISRAKRRLKSVERKVHSLGQKVDVFAVKTADQQCKAASQDIAVNGRGGKYGQLTEDEMKILDQKLKQAKSLEESLVQVLESLDEPLPALFPTTQSSDPKLTAEDKDDLGLAVMEMELSRIRAKKRVATKRVLALTAALDAAVQTLSARLLD